MPSFDIVVEVDTQEIDNAVNQAVKEIGQRYDFRGSKSKIDWDKDKEITLVGDDDYKLRAVLEVLQSKMIKRGISVKNLVLGTPESATEGTMKQKVTVQQGIPTEHAKKITKLIKEKKLKVQPQIQDEQVRVTGKKRDDLQEVIAAIRNADFDLEFQFVNFRD